MKKIVALGGGAYAAGEIQNIFEYIVSLSGKENPSVLFIPTAGFDDINGDEVIQSGFEKCGCSFDILFLTKEKRTVEDIGSAILGADIIYVGGGNVEFMMKTWRETGADKYLIEAYNQGKVMSGYSAGADCWFSESYDDCAPGGEFMFCDGLGIFPYSACPHYESGHWQTFKEAIKTRSIPGIAMEDGAAFICLDGKFSTMHGNDGGSVYLLKDGEEINLSEMQDCNELLKAPLI